MGIYPVVCATYIIGVGSLVRLGGGNCRIDTALEAKYWVGHGSLAPPVPTPMYMVV